MSDESSTSNPRHPWNLSAPSMTNQRRFFVTFSLVWIFANYFLPPSFHFHLSRLASTNSLSNGSSVASSSMPGTPLDGTFNYTTTPSYPSHSNPTSFTDMNGNTLTFQSSSPPLSVYPSLPSTSTSGPVSHGFIAQAYANAQNKQQNFTTTTGEVRIETPQNQTETMMVDEGVNEVQEEEKPRVLAQPTYGYGWDYPRQSNAFALGGHLV